MYMTGDTHITVAIEERMRRGWCCVVVSLLLSLVFFQATAHDIPMQPRTAIG